VGGLREFGVAIARIVLGMVVLIGGLVVLDILVYLSATGNTFGERVAAAYQDSYTQGYAKTYEVAYQEAHGAAYDKGYDKGYEIGLLGSDSRKEVASRVDLRNPTYKEMRDFLASDEIDSNSFIRGEYVCSDFAADLNHNAEVKGIRVAYVRIALKNGGMPWLPLRQWTGDLFLLSPSQIRKQSWL